LLLPAADHFPFSDIFFLQFHGVDFIFYALLLLFYYEMLKKLCLTISIG